MLVELEPAGELVPSALQSSSVRFGVARTVAEAVGTVVEGSTAGLLGVVRQGSKAG